MNFKNTKRILLTGATGNIGQEVVRFHHQLNSPNILIAGVRDIEKAREKFIGYPELEFVLFDFEEPATFQSALQNIDLVFLLRPPQISNVGRYFKPLIDSMVKSCIRQIIFISVQGAEKSRFIPHNQIEKLIVSSNVNAIFLRPGYFMQNLTTTLLQDIQKYSKIIVPAGNAKFNWIDIENIAEVVVILFEKFEQYQGNPLEITGDENKNFAEIAWLITSRTGKNIGYESPNLLKFFMLKKRDGLKAIYILVIIMLHYLQRFQKEPVITHFYEKLTGKKPNSLATFIDREKELFFSAKS